MAGKSVVGGTEGKGKKRRCRWKGCKVKEHVWAFDYPNDGVVERKSLCDWSHPSELYTKVYKTDELEYSRKIYKRGKRKSTADSYAIQKHHVIPCAVFKQLTNIKGNLKLLGFDINNELRNGISLPSRPEDIVWHDLQYHRGSHPIYNTNVGQELKDLDKKVGKYCLKSDQKKLEDEIDESVKYFKGKILKWDASFLLKEDALLQRKIQFSSNSDSKTEPAKRSNRK